MALNTPIIFHEPYGFSMLECLMGYYDFFPTYATLCRYLAILSPDWGLLVGHTLDPFCDCFTYIAITTGWWKGSMLGEQSHPSIVFLREINVWSIVQGKLSTSKTSSAFSSVLLLLALTTYLGNGFQVFQRLISTVFILSVLFPRNFSLA